MIFMAERDVKPHTSIQHTHWLIENLDLYSSTLGGCDGWWGWAAPLWAGGGGRGWQPLHAQEEERATQTAGQVSLPLRNKYVMFLISVMNSLLGIVIIQTSLNWNDTTSSIFRNEPWSGHVTMSHPFAWLAQAFAWIRHGLQQSNEGCRDGQCFVGWEWGTFSFDY